MIGAPNHLGACKNDEPCPAKALTIGRGRFEKSILRRTVETTSKEVALLATVEIEVDSSAASCSMPSIASSPLSSVSDAIPEIGRDSSFGRMTRRTQSGFGSVTSLPSSKWWPMRNWGLSYTHFSRLRILSRSGEDTPHSSSTSSQ
jgi:hypothetical protein